MLWSKNKPTVPKYEDYGEEEYDLLLSMATSKYWPVLKKFIGNQQDLLNQRAIAVRNEESLEMFMRMDELDELVKGIENLVPPDDTVYPISVRKLQDLMP